MVESLTSSARSSRMILRELSSREITSRSLIAERTSFTKDMTTREVRVMVEARPTHVAVMERGSMVLT